MTVLVLCLLFVLIVVIPLSGIVTMVLFWRNPFSGAMFASLQLIVGVGVRLMMPNLATKLPYNLDLGFLKLGPSDVEVSPGASNEAAYVLLGVALLGLMLGSIGYLVMFQVEKTRRKPGWLQRVAAWFGGRRGSNRGLTPGLAGQSLVAPAGRPGKKSPSSPKGTK